MLALLLYCLLGVFAGTLSGMLGIGGGLLVVPGLFMIFKFLHVVPDTTMHVAAGTSLAVMIATTARGLSAHLKRKIVIWPVYQTLVWGVIAGVISGVFVAHYVPSRWLKMVFAVFVLLIALRLLTKHHRHATRDLPGWLGNNLVGSLIGLKSGLLGVGGGALSVPYLTYCNVPLRKAVVVSTAISLTVAIVGAITAMIIGFDATSLLAWTTGYVYWPACFGVALGSVLFAPVGVALSHRLPVTVLQRIFAVFLLLVGLHLLF